MKKYVLNFGEFLFEANKVQKYYDENSDKLKSFNINYKGSNFDINSILRSFGYSNPLLKNYNQLEKDIKEKYKLLYGDISFDYKFLHRYLKKEIDKNDIINRNFSKKFIDNFDTIINDKLVRDYINISYEADKYQDNIIKKISMKYGIKPDDFIGAMYEINRMQSKSYQKLSPEYFPVLKAMTVDKNNLPKIVYRGFFIDGAKIKDQTKFLKQWAEGNQPKVKLGKATSWSTAKATASQFISSQDRVKDKENGYHILIRLDNPTYEEVIADFRNLDFSPAWNQQEILIDPSVTRYVVEKLMKHEEHSSKNYNDTNYAKYVESIPKKKYAGANMLIKDRELMNLFDYNDIDIDTNLKISYKAIKDKTVGELNKEHILNTQNFEYNDLLLPLYVFYVKIFDSARNSYYTELHKVINQNLMEIEISIPFYKRDLYPDSINNNFIYDKDALYAFGQIKLIKNNINDFNFEIALPKKFTLNKESYGYKRDFKNYDILLNNTNKNIDDFNQNFIDNINKSLKNYKTIKVNFK